jgi:hypothetical protein
MHVRSEYLSKSTEHHHKVRLWSSRTNDNEGAVQEKTHSLAGFEGVEPDLKFLFGGGVSYGSTPTESNAEWFA